MNELVRAFILIFVAEMGDKSQLLALAFATKYPLKTVLAGVSLGIALNHGVAILLAFFVSQFIPLESLKILSVVVFLSFGFKSLWLNFEEEEEEASFGNLGPILGMAATFFLGEFGDKTQLTAMTLAVGSEHPFLIFLTTVTAMISVSVIGIFTGKVLGKKIPEVTMQFIAAGLFLFFGVTTLFEVAPVMFGVISAKLITVLLVVVISGLILNRNRKSKEAYTVKVLSQLIQGCNYCEEHRVDCPRGIQINKMTEAYIGEEIPFLGNVIGYLEKMKAIDPSKTDFLKMEIQK